MYNHILSSILGCLGQKAMDIGFPYNRDWYRFGCTLWVKAGDLLE